MPAWSSCDPANRGNVKIQDLTPISPVFKENIISFISTHKAEFEQKFGIKKIGLFGSYARGESHEGSEDQKYEPVPDLLSPICSDLFENT